jgi:hypothetical protein
VGHLSIQDLVVEFSGGGYAVRPINGLSLDVAAGSRFDLAKELKAADIDVSLDRAI